MATQYRSPTQKRKCIKAKPRDGMDREELREDINARYENTLRYLGR